MHTKVVIVSHKYALENVAIGKRDEYGLVYMILPANTWVGGNGTRNTLKTDQDMLTTKDDHCWTILPIINSIPLLFFKIMVHFEIV